MKRWIALVLVISVFLCLSGCGEDRTYQIEDGKCTIEVTTENAANYEWVTVITDENVLRLDSTGNNGSGADFTGYSSASYFVLSGLSEGTSDLYLNYKQTYEGGSLSAITKGYTLTVDGDGKIVTCLQLANTLGVNGGTYSYLKCDPSAGEAWSAQSADESILTVNRTGSEQDSDKSHPEIVWEVFHFSPVAAGSAEVDFTLSDEAGDVLRTLTYEVVVGEDDSVICQMLG